MIRSGLAALKMFILMIILTGLIYPLLITLIAQLTMTEKADGSLLYSHDKLIGSRLIAQNFKSEAYFWPRPSAVDYDPLKPAGGSNLGPTSQKLKESVNQKVKSLGNNPPAELVYGSGSGLDPHISLATAYFQLERVAKARSIANQEQLRFLIESLSEGFGMKYVNVLILNTTLDQQYPLPAS